ncbi:dUTP diphosphatase [Rossellomorea aquimaris]|uniref:dUTPase n=1 Tax=Rossellomorea aquimaris TaxID=189382 RepID=A0A5D4UI91_9BACI|nr:dUTP diphosphatase [Rossellomorea aquimaris]TYS77873.1 dUTPase [Rossellomorea aquimaris]TYS87056.1 dUTPase [Rossellomorea aquimaris]
MNIEKLLDMQEKLDQHIEQEHGLENADLIEKKILALLVEVGELANETRSFKFWSKKSSSSKEVILEEFVDGIHFILSLGLEIGIQQFDLGETNYANEDVTKQFLEVFKSANHFSEERSVENFQQLFRHYVNLGELLGFSHEEVFDAYVKKNEVNYNRQKEGY